MVQMCGDYSRIRGPLQLTAHHTYETRAKSVGTGEIFVASRLVDLPFAAERRIQRHNGKAIGFLIAVTASLADQVVD